MAYGCYVLLLMGIVWPLHAKDCRDIHLHNNIDAQQLWQDFTKLADKSMQGRKTGSAGAKKARDYIQTRFAELGLRPFAQYSTYDQTFNYPSDSSSNIGVNVLAFYQGTHLPEQYIVLTAHYDHLGQRGNKIFYGADDNASGVAALLALAEALVEQSSVYSVIFVATDAEENGLYGAKAFVRNAPVELQNIRLNINLDMLAEGGRRKRLYVTSGKVDDWVDSQLQNIITRAGLCLVKGHRSSLGNRSTVQNINWRKASDHAAFAKLNIPYLFIGVDTHPNYHTSEDRVEQVDPLFYTAATETAWLILQAVNQ